MARDRASFGKHQVLARLGRGGMGNVYLAVNFGPGGVHKLVVIKQLRTDLAQTPDVRPMFLDEARIGARLNHPNVVQTNEVVDEGDELYLLMDFLDGQSLARILGSKHRAHFSRAMRLRILADALAGLHYAHELTDYDGTPLNIVHHDVSPQNILVTYDGHVKILDFGVATARGTTTESHSGTFKGKVRYAAPEQTLCREADRRVDIFAVGIILFEILTERRMWPELTDRAILMALTVGNVPGARELPADVPPPLRAICARALQHQPDARYPTAQDFRSDLLAYLRTTNEDTELGGTVTASFARERRDLHSVIDAQIRAVREASVRSLEARTLPLIGADSDVSGSDRRSSLPVPVESDVRPAPRRRGWATSLAIGGVLVGVASVVARPALLRPARSEPPSSLAASLAPSSGVDRAAHSADAPSTVAPEAHMVPAALDAPLARAVDLTVKPAALAAPARKPLALPPRAPGGSALAAPPKAKRTIDEESPYR